METENKVFEPRIPQKPHSTKKIVISAIAILLAIALIVGLVIFLIPRPAVFSYEGISVDPEMYALWYSMLKVTFINRYLNNGTVSSVDKESTWSAPCVLEEGKGMTWGEFIDGKIREAIKIKLISARLYDSLGLQMADNQRRAIDVYCQEMLTYAADGDSGKLAELTATYKTTPDALRRCAILDLKAELLYRHLAYYADTAITTGDDGDGYYLTASELNSYYSDRYLRAMIVYVNNEHYYTIENGVRVEHDFAIVDGPNTTNDQDIAALDALLDTTVAPDVLADYIARSDEGLHVAYPNGVFFTLSSDLSAVTGLETKDLYPAAYSGKLTKLETKDGVCYVQGYPITTGDYRREDNADFFSDFYKNAADAAITARAKALLDRVSENLALCEGLDVYTIPHQTNFRVCSMSTVGQTATPQK